MSLARRKAVKRAFMDAEAMDEDIICVVIAIYGFLVASVVQKLRLPRTTDPCGSAWTNLYQHMLEDRLCPGIEFRKHLRVSPAMFHCLCAIIRADVEFQ